MRILIDTVRISNFRSLKNIEIKLLPLIVLVGANNAGKTSFLKAINLALGVERRNVSKEDFYIGIDDKDETNEIKIDVRIIPQREDFIRAPDFSDLWRDVEFGDLINVDANDQQYVSFRTKISFSTLKNDYEIRRYKINEWKDDKADWEKVEYKDPLKSSFSFIPLFFIDAQRDILEDLRSRTSYLGRLISKVRIDSKKVSELEAKIKELNDEIIGSSDVLSHLKKRLNELNQTIQSGSTGVDISPVNKKIRDLNKGININFQDGKNESFPLEYHGMGTRSWASLLTFKAYISWLSENYEKEGTSPYHPILALEEPEAHLHPNAQRHLYSQLLDIGGQKIISSHSPYIAGQCKILEVVHFFKKDDNPQISVFDSANLSKDEIRKLQREVMHSRGELLFSRGIVLFEGETEEQALPVFAKAYWGKHPFELGLNFVGVGGNGFYLPFVRFCISFNIPWFIFSDGEDDTISKLESALKKTKVQLNGASNIIIVPKKENFEQHLVSEGFQNEIKCGIATSTAVNETHYAAKLVELGPWKDTNLLEYMESHKTAICTDVAEKIVSIEDKARRFPKSIRELLDMISKQLSIKIDERNV